MSYNYFVTLQPATKEAQDYEFILEELINDTSWIFGIDRSSLYEKDRTDRVKLCRWTVWQIMWGCHGYSMTKAARIFGDYDHTSVLHALRSIQAVIGEKDHLKEMYSAVIKRFSIDESKIKYRTRVEKIKPEAPLARNLVTKRRHQQKMYEYQKLKEQQNKAPDA